MKSAFLACFSAIAFHYCFASEEQLSVSPDRRFAVLSTPGEYPRLISLPSRQVVLADLLDEQARTPSVRWSEDSTRVVCWVQQGRFTAFAVYRRRENSFEALYIPEIKLPFESSLKGKESRSIGEAESPVRWVTDDTLIINKTGTINLYEDHEPSGGFDYSYDITIHFDKQGNGNVLKIRKAPVRRDQ
jgi:hypothetical protein